jgi:RNA polymerase sigma factor (sigma-70 family)
MTLASLSAVVGCVRRLAARDPRCLADHPLLDRFARERDEAAFAELVRRHGPMVLAACRRVLRHEHDAEDAFQAAFLVLARKAGSIRQHEALGGWLYRVAHRLALRARAVAARRREEATDQADTLPAPSADPWPGELDEELRRLPERYRTAVVLCYLEGYTQAEAARMLATTAEVVNSRLKRARDQLRVRLGRPGRVLSGVAVAAALSGGAAQAALPPALVRLTARTAREFAAGGVSACRASAPAVALAKGALRSMTLTKAKLVLAALAAVVALLTAGALLVPPALGDNTPAQAADQEALPKAGKELSPAAKGEAKARPACIILWMNGGPSQIDTFDPKPNDPNGRFFPAVETNVKGVQISGNLPRLAKMMDKLAILRTVSHREGDHARGAYLMSTGRSPGGLEHPPLGCVLAKELGDGLGDVPRYVSISDVPANFGGFGLGTGFLAKKYAPVPADSAGEQTKAVAKAFDLNQEPAEVHNHYGNGKFGQGCLLARRLVEVGVPVVAVSMSGWDMHANIPGTMPMVASELDAGMTALINDLDKSKRLDSTLLVWMGEFGRTPQINKAQGRDHWMAGFSVVLAGRGIKGGQAIGKTSPDGMKVVERPVSPPELLATIYQALGVDPAKENRTPDGEQVPLVPKGTAAVKEALR